MVIAAATRPLAHCQQDGASTARRADIARHWLAQPPSRRRTNERDWLMLRRVEIIGVKRLDVWQ